MNDRIVRILGILVILGALSTIPLTVVAERGSTGLIVTVGDWLVWSISWPSI